jgi:magnesium transporter
MIRGYAIEDRRLRPVPDPLADPEAVVWFDLVSPDPAEEARVETLVGIDVPTLDEMAEIEDSARLYLDRGAVFLTAALPVGTESGHPIGAPVTFILAGHRLVTVRYESPRAFETFPQRAERLDLGCSDGESVLLALLDAIVERLADILEAVARRIEDLSRTIFSHGATNGGTRGAPDFRRVLQGVGSQANVVSHVLASLVTIERHVAFLGAARDGIAARKDARGRLKSLSRDTRFLAEHATFLSQKVNFLLDATLGMISIQQNAIIKIFSVAAVIFLPPTLVASIYGMNFSDMPELSWAFGYPMAIVLMIASAIGSYWVFKTRGWL